MPKRYIEKTVFDASVERMVKLYEQGHRIVVSFSGGKDSGVCLEICIIAAKITNKLPIDVIMRDEEIMFPGTFEYAERIAQRPEVNFHWIYACQPIINIFNRECPYFWVFDPLLELDQWVRRPPSIAYKIDNLDIGHMTIPKRFPPKKGKNLYAVIGITAGESQNRMRSIYSRGGYVTKKANKYGVYNVAPIYDWKVGDIFKAIKDNNWDWNSAYDVLARHGIPKTQVRIAPPTMQPAGIKLVQVAARAWPLWFNKVCERLHGVRNGVYYGQRSVEPIRKYNETWKECFFRTCLNEAPKWIAERSMKFSESIIRTHNNHSISDFPEKTSCFLCGQWGCWEKLAKIMYTGDPFLSRLGAQGQLIGYVEPEYFRQGAGKWDGKPTF